MGIKDPMLEIKICTEITIKLGCKKFWCRASEIFRIQNIFAPWINASGIILMPFAVKTMVLFFISTFFAKIILVKTEIYIKN